MNSSSIHTFDRSGTLPVRTLFSAAGATLHVRPLGALPCAPPSSSSRAAFASLKQDTFVFTKVHYIEQCLQGHFTDEQCNSWTPTFRIMDLSNIFISKGTIEF